MSRHLAQLNIGRLRHDVGDPRMAEFVDNLALVNGLAERSPGFVWRYQDDSGSAIDTRPFDGDPRMAINLSVWDSVEALERFVRREPLRLTHECVFGVLALESEPVFRKSIQANGDPFVVIRDVALLAESLKGEGGIRSRKI